MQARETTTAAIIPLTSLVAVFTKEGQEKMPSAPMLYCTVFSAPSTPPPMAETTQVMMKGVFFGRVMP